MFTLPAGYLVGMLAWLTTGAVCFVLLLALRRRSKQTSWKLGRRLADAGLRLLLFVAAPLTALELWFAVVYDQSDSFNMSKVSQHWFARHVRENDQSFRDDRPFPHLVP